MDIVLSKDGVKCAVFKISDVQILFGQSIILINKWQKTAKNGKKWQKTAILK